MTIGTEGPVPDGDLLDPKKGVASLDPIGAARGDTTGSPRSHCPSNLAQ